MGFFIQTKLKSYPFWSHIYAYRRRYLIGLAALLVVNILNVSLPLAVRHAIDATVSDRYSSVFWAGALLIALMVGQSVMRYVWRLYLIGTSHYIARDIRIRLYDHLQQLPLSYYSRVRTGDLMSRATNDIESIRMAVGPGILVSIDAILVFSMITPVMFWLSWKLTLLAFAIYPIVPWLTQKLGDKIDILFESLQSKMSNMSAYTQESFAAIRLIKSLVLESQVRRHFCELSELYEKEGIQLAKVQAVFAPSLQVITLLGSLLILLVGGYDVIKGIISIGTFVAFQRFVVQLHWPMEAIGWAVSLNREGYAAHRRLDAILSVPKIQSIRHKEALPKDSKLLLEIDKVQFKYPTTEFSLRLQDLAVGSGQRIGIVGPVGSGKSTLFHLILRLYETEMGSIYWKGKDIATIALDRLRSEIASVEQEIYLFSETVHTNLSLGNTIPLNEQTIHHIAEQARFHDEIIQLDQGFKTYLGERGVNLSGGQKQRVAIGRALLRNPQLLLLDDCFSAIDVQIEKEIIETLIHRYPQLTMMMASHRLSIMPYMDAIWVLDQGRVVTLGTHETLLNDCSLYQSLWQNSNLQAKQTSTEIHSDNLVS